ncbi:hypothetical protein HU200_052484 [Digitaria exilis]|uniref:AN1-type domain-containing protein n=1 Tax=Digitaria exilis TaxID=1010633 RepID=A0A835ANK3_9POAL|nr:hypothetical protein HU200_052484 [Digitaria exilis]
MSPFGRNAPTARARSLSDHRARDPKYEACARAPRRSRLPCPRFPTDTSTQHNNSVTPVMAEKPAAQCGGCAAPLPWGTLGRGILMFETAETRDLCAACAMAYYYRTGGLGGGRSATSPFPFANAAAVPPPAEKASAAATKPNRCAACRRKVGLLGFPCRCGGTFCASHRHAETHGCGFDHGDQLGRKRTARENPGVVVAPKEHARARLLKLEEQSEPCHEKACRASPPPISERIQIEFPLLPRLARYMGRAYRAHSGPETLSPSCPQLELILPALPTPPAIRGTRTRDLPPRAIRP